MKLLRRWTLLAIVLASPYALLILAGWRWLYEQGWLLWWAVAAVVMTFCGLRLVDYLRRSEAKEDLKTVQPSATWTPTGEQAWQKVELLSQRLCAEQVPLDGPQQWWDILEQVLDTVARHYHPQSKNPLLEVPIPYLLKIVELVAQDLRRFASEHVPAAHILTVNDLRTLRDMASQGGRLYKPGYELYRLARLGLNPVMALFREFNDSLAGNLWDKEVGQTKDWLLDLFIKRSGFYAIELYSGHLLLDEGKFAEFQMARSVADETQAVERGEMLSAEPLRMLVLGQVKAGKSRLINAVFGETRAAVDVVPRTRHIEPFVLEREGIQRAIILDTAGYDEVGGPTNPYDELREEVLKCDLVLLVSKANNAARQADRRLLDGLRSFYQSQPSRRMPPVIVVLTHIDLLRPLAEWSPPYDLAHPKTPKARQIADALQAVAEDLAIPPDQIVPVCLAEGRVYNVDEALVPAIVQILPEVDRVKYLRCLQQFRDEEYWQRLWQQAANTGRVFVQGGKMLATHAGKKLEEYLRSVPLE